MDNFNTTNVFNMTNNTNPMTTVYFPNTTMNDSIMATGMPTLEPTFMPIFNDTNTTTTAPAVVFNIAELPPDQIATMAYGGLTVLLNIAICVIAARDVRKKVQKAKEQQNKPMKKSIFPTIKKKELAKQLDLENMENETKIGNFEAETRDGDINLGGTGDTDNMDAIQEENENSDDMNGGDKKRITASNFGDDLFDPEEPIVTEDAGGFEDSVDLSNDDDSVNDDDDDSKKDDEPITTGVTIDIAIVKKKTIDESIFDESKKGPQDEEDITTLKAQLKALFKGIMGRYNIYVSVLVHLWDTATDIGVLVGWFSTAELKPYDFNGDSNTLWFALWSLIFMLAYRVFGAVSVYGTLGLGASVLQLLDFLMLRELYETYTDEDLEPTVHLHLLRRLEAVFEAAPQLLVQLVFLMQESGGAIGDIWLQLMSIGLSSFSIGSAIVKDDAWKFGGIDSAWNKAGRTKKWWIRFLFRVFEVVSRLACLAVLWLCTNVIIILVFLGIQLFFFGVLYYNGQLGNEFGNIMSILIAYPNLSIRENYYDISVYIKILGYSTLWTVFSDLIPPIDTTDLHYLSRSFENSLVVFLSLYYQAIQKDPEALVFDIFTSIKDVRVIFSFISVTCGILAAFIYFTQVKPRIINVQNLNLDIWGVLKRADDPDNVDMLQKFVKRAPHSINEYNRRDGIVPLMQCTEMADFTILKWFLNGPPVWHQSSANINVKWKAPNIYHRDKKGRTVLWYIIMHRKITSDDIQGTHEDDMYGQHRKKNLMYIKSKDFERRTKWFKAIIKFSYSYQPNPLDGEWRELVYTLIKGSQKKVDFTLINSQSKFYDNYSKYWAKKWENIEIKQKSVNSDNVTKSDNGDTKQDINSDVDIDDFETVDVLMKQKNNNSPKSDIEMMTIKLNTETEVKEEPQTIVQTPETQSNPAETLPLFGGKSSNANKYRTYEAEVKMQFKVKLHHIGRDGTGYVSKIDLQQRNPFKRWWKEGKGTRTKRTESLGLNPALSYRQSITARNTSIYMQNEFKSFHMSSFRPTEFNDLFSTKRQTIKSISPGNNLLAPNSLSPKREPLLPKSKYNNNGFQLLDTYDPSDAIPETPNETTLLSPKKVIENPVTPVNKISINGGATPLMSKTPVYNEEIKEEFPTTKNVKMLNEQSESSSKSITAKAAEQELEKDEKDFVFWNIAHSIREIAEHTATKLTIDEHTRIYVSLSDKSGQTALHFASIMRDDDFVGILLQMGVNPNIKDIYGNTAMHYALKTDWVKDKAEILQNAYNEHSVLFKEYKERETHNRVHGKEVRRGAMQVVDRFIHWNLYCKIKKKKIAKTELERIIAENKENKENSEIIAYHKHCHDFVECNWTIKNNLNHDVFFVACVLDEPKYLIQFHESKIKLNTSDINGNNILSFCIINERYKCIDAILNKHLLEFDTLWHENNNYLTSFEIAVEYREWWLLPLILKQTYNEEGLIRILTKASLYDNKELIDIIFQHCGRYIEAYGHQIIETAVRKNKFYVIKLLAKQKPHIFKNVNARGESSAFHCVKFGQLTMLQWLLDNVPYYMNLNHTNHYGMNLFQTAYLYHQRHCYKYLKQIMPIWEDKCKRLFGDEWNNNDMSDDTDNENSVTYSTYSVRAIP